MLPRAVGTHVEHGPGDTDRELTERACLATHVPRVSRSLETGARLKVFIQPAGGHGIVSISATSRPDNVTSGALTC